MTTTVTEAGYCAAPDGGLDLEDADVQADLAAYREGRTDDLLTMPVRVVSGLAGRRAAGAGGLTLVACDNLPGDGAIARGRRARRGPRAGP